MMLTAKMPRVTLPQFIASMQFRRLIALLVFAALSLARLPLASACAVCVSGAEGPAADGYAWSVLFLMAAPYVVIGSIAGYFVYAYRRALRKESAEAAAESGAALNLKPIGESK
jgi:hypothetical protein